VDLSNGAAIFNAVRMRKAGTYTLIATANGLSSMTSGSFIVSPAAASKLAFTMIPSGATHGSGFTVAVSVEDAYGNTVTSQNAGTISLVLGSHPTGSFLSGTATAKIVNGVATFSNLSVNLAGTYTLTASDSISLAGTTSASFAVG
jgi:hypothetical protein